MPMLSNALSATLPSRTDPTTLLPLSTELESAVLIQAGETAPETPQGGAGGPFDSIMGFMPVILIFGIMYFVLIGPERKQRKKREAMLKALKKGDKVLTTGGLHGVIASITDTQVVLQVDEGVRLKFSRSAIADVQSDDGGAKDGAAK